MPNPNPNQDNLKPEKMINGEIQKLPRKTNSTLKVQLTIRVEESTRQLIREYAKKRSLSQGDTLDLIVKAFMETEKH